MAARAGLSQTAVSRIWRAFALAPPRSETFKLSKDPPFVETGRDVVGLYLAPPDRALVLAVDEKDADPGPGAHRAGRADPAGAVGAPHARLHPARDD